MDRARASTALASWRPIFVTPTSKLTGHAHPPAGVPLFAARTQRFTYGTWRVTFQADWRLAEFRPSSSRFAGP
jgi:hypothetical protein